MAIFFFVVSLVIYLEYHFEFSHPFASELPADVQTKIQNMQDIDKLRDLALTLEKRIQVERKSFNDVWESGIDVLITFSFMTGFLCLVNAGSWRRFSLEQRKEYIPWWLRLFR
jgi:hypothetical protein